MTNYWFSIVCPYIQKQLLKFKKHLGEFPMSLFISNAYAEGGAAPGAAGPDMLIMLAIFGLIFYFMIYRPQAKRVKEHKNLVSSLAKGDEVLTAGGIIGKITKVSDDKDFVKVELAEGTEVMIQKGSISSVLPKGTIKSI